MDYILKQRYLSLVSISSYPHGIVGTESAMRTAQQISNNIIANHSSSLNIFKIGGLEEGVLKISSTSFRSILEGIT